MNRSDDNPWEWSKAFGFSQGVEVSAASRFLVCSGQTAIGADGSPPEQTDMGAQVHKAFDNLQAVLEAAGMSPAHVIRINYCQRPLGIPHWRPLEFPRDGHENSPRTATEFPALSTGQRHHPLARSGVDQADRFTFGDDDVGMVQEPVNES